MRSFVLPLALLVATAAAVPAKPAECVTKGNTVIEYYDQTITHTVYVTADAVPTSRTKHTHKPKPTTTPSAAPVYTPPPQPEPEPTQEYVPPPVYSPPPPPPPPPKQESPSDLGEDEKTCLELHNKYRAAHGAQPLSWDYDAAKQAEYHTQTCHMAHTQDRNGYGENLAFGYPSVSAAITEWYNEKDKYRGGFSMESGHYSQLVWKATSKLGCYNRNCNGRQYLMCWYKSPGNVGGQYADNVQ